ncbi:FAD dependent oxidoreductase [Archangium gephyra]|uniref:FAD dependent oxidoreductase n=1 Tax=Archangium gephyra TaxID=48 RepID=A0ABX9K0M3_9BACT|nr:tetratricopeptide repeat protein [Archangium gephyra]REG30915.1 FAD dependent oxidoreductase [Archangium gephyra]
MATVTERDILQQMVVREEAGVYVLGCFERRITLYTQQIRALNLVHSLFAEERLKASSTLAVIGGGAAGLTAAAGAAIRGARVTVFEQASDLLAMFRNNRQRWLHPHLYDWPEEGSGQEQADVPVLDWKADLAGNVAERLLAQWQPLAQRYGIEVHTRVRRLQLLPGSGVPRRLTWNTESFDEGEFDAVILAVGFGTERTLEGAPSRSYWEDDNLDRLLLSPNSPKRYLISGTGDGGLIDLLRVRLRDFRHERIIQRYLRDASLGEVKTELLKLEEEFRKGRLHERDFFKKYKDLPVPKALDERLREDLRGDTAAVLNGRDASPLSARASILNRFLTSRLMRLGVRYEFGELTVKRVKDAYEVAFLDEKKHPKHVEEFDDIIVRHGPQPALEHSFKSLWDKAGARMRDLAELDQTRRPLFKSEHFAHSLSVAGVSTSTAPAVVSAPAVAPPRGDCFGREEQTRQLVAAVLAEEPRPTMVLGPPGIGKSTLTLQAYHHPEVARRYGNRRYFVRLDGATSRELMVSAVAAVLGIKSETDLWEAVKHALQSAPALLVLDNVETPWDADRSGTESLLAELRDLPGLALVCSVRGGERPFVSRSGPPIEVTRLDGEAARDLFCSIAWKVDRKDPLLERLLHEQDGLPLAIKLLAFTAEGASLENTWRLWQQERAALYERPGGGLDRQSSLSSSLEVSIKGPRMTDEARRLLSLLSKLPGGVAQEDLDRLLPGMGNGAAQVLSKVGLAFFEKGRLRMLAPILEHVRRSRNPSAEDLERMSNHYLGMPRIHGEKVGRVGGGEASTLLIVEFTNIEGVIEEELSGQRAMEAMDAAIALSKFMRFSGHGTPRILQRASEVARNKGDAGREANCIQSLGDIALERSQHEEARRRYEEALPLHEQVGDVLGRANCIQSLGDIALRRSQHEEARRRYEEALPLYAQVGAVLGRANCIRRLGDIALERSQHEEARRRYEEALPLYEQVGAVLGRANCIQRLGDIALRRSQHEEARRRYEEALPLHEQVGAVLGRANCIKSLGDIALERSQHEEARRRYEEALPLYEQVGAVLGRANCIRRLGDIALERSQHEEARGFFVQSLSFYMLIPEPYSIGLTHQRLARIALNVEERRRHIASARKAWESIDRSDLIQQLRDEFGDDHPGGR